MERENIINDILNSTNGITKVSPNADLFSKIEEKIHATSTVSNKTIWWVAASIVILVSLNITVISTKNESTNNQTAAALASTLSQSNQLY